MTAYAHTEILRFLIREPVSMGEPHPATTLLADLFSSNPYSATAFILSSTPAVMADLLRLAARIDVPLDQQTRLVKYGLSQPDVDVRDAVVGCVEEWTDNQEIFTLLKQHVENEDVPWLREYMEMVIAEREGG